MIGTTLIPVAALCRGFLKEAELDRSIQKLQLEHVVGESDITEPCVRTGLCSPGVTSSVLSSSHSYWTGLWSHVSSSAGAREELMVITEGLWDYCLRFH